MPCCPQRRLWVLFACPLLLLNWFQPSNFAKPSRSSGKARCGSWHVSNYGRCRNLFGVITHGFPKARNSYLRVNIEGKLYYVHRLVKFAFHGPPQSDAAWQVNHLDGNKTNNHLENLQYATPSENVQHSFARGSRRCGGLKRCMPVMWRAVGLSGWTARPSIQSAAKCLGLSHRTVSRCCHEQRSAKGFEFKFAHDATSCMDGTEAELWRKIRDPKSGRIIGNRLVSSLDRLKLRGGRISKGSKDSEGYFSTQLPCLQQMHVFVHRLVAAAFLGGPPSSEHTQINHKDGDKGNNAVDNLEYASPVENIAHRFATALTYRPRSDSKAVCSRLFGTDDSWTSHVSISRASSRLGINPGTISRCIRGLQTQTGGFVRLAATNAAEDLPGEEWREVDLAPHHRDRAARR